MSKDNEGNAQTPDLPGFVGTPTEDQGSPFVGPVDKTGATAPLGMQGKQRFDYVMTQHPGSMQEGGPDYDSWLLSLPEDAADIQYTMLLRQAKAAAKARNNARSQAGPGGQLPGIYPEGGPPKPGQQQAGQGVITGIKKSKPLEAGQAVSGAPPGATQQPFNGENPGAPGAGKMKQDPTEQKEHREYTAGVPIIEGLPVDVTDAGVKVDPNNPGGAPDPFVQQWATDEGLSVSNDQAKIAAKSGQWVYVGEVADPAGGMGYTRSKYVYVDDAEAELSAFSSDEIKKYQKQLGQDVTGVITPDLQAIWHNAVQAAQLAARAGKKVELRFLFDQLVAAKASAGSGGGGGGAFGNESGADMVGSDYYQAMMAVLGDISGVGK